MLRSVISVLSILVMLSIEILTPFAYAVDSQGGVVVEDVNVIDLGGNTNIQEIDKEAELEEAWETLNEKVLEKAIRHKRVIIRVTAKAESFPEGTEIEITPVIGEEYEQVKQQITDTQENIDESVEMVAVDIKFLYTLSNGEKVELQPKDENSVTVSFDYSRNSELKEAEASEEQEIQIFHINDKDEEGNKVEEGEEEIEKIEINEEKSEDINNGVVIDAESFSYYTIVVQRREEAPESAPTQTWQYGENYFTISIARPSSYSATDYPIEGFTIMDRNLGASISGTTCNTNNATGACGYLYQWGNNYGFPISANANSILTGVGLTWDDSYNNNGYVSKKFVNGSSFDKDVWSNSSHNDGLWGGANDVDYSGAVGPSGLYWDDGRDRTLRQGPCPEGWHVPSAGEWSMLVDYWYYTNYSSHPSVSSNLYYFSDAEKREAFMNKFYIPFAGRRSYSTADLKNQGSYGYSWSSSPYGSDGPDYARRLRLSSSDVGADDLSLRAYGLSVRCFKDSYVASPESSNLVDTQAWVEGKDFETITISNPENSNEGFTIMDRNLGASISGTVCDKTNNTGSCGFLYQWGNNYGFPITTETVTPVTTGLTWNNVYNNHGYFSTNFINGSSHDYDVWDGTNPTANDKEHHDGVWGGANDDQSANNWGLDSNNPTDRQGPCPVGYHIPSAGEWSKIFEYWCKKNPSKCDMDNMHEEVGLYYNYNDQDIGTNFAGDLKLPFAGYRNYSTADLDSQGSYGYYWSSSPYSAGSSSARRLYLNSSSVYADIDFRRARGLSVRCFKDSYVAPKTYTLTFDSQGGSEVTSQTVVEGQTRSRPAQNPTKEHYSFVNWYTSTGYTALFDFSAPAYANATAYAKWNDGKAPSNVSVTTTSNEKATTQTATLSCTDEIGVTKYYWGTSSSPLDSAYTAVTSTTNFSTTQPVSSAGIYYLFCKDAAGNTSASVSKAYYTYSVQNMLDKVAGTQGTHNTTNYETNGNSMGTYIIPSGTTITLNSASLYGDPISSHDTYAGYTTSNSGTPTTSNPTISSNTTYYRWYNRDSHPLTLNKGTGISSVSGAGTIKHGATANIDATVSAGYTWENWTKSAGNDPASATTKNTTVTITKATTLTANASDQTKPEASISTTSTLKSASQTATLSCTDGVGVVSYYWGTSAPTSSSTYTSVTSTTSFSTTKTVNAAGTYYLACKDAAGNVSTNASKVYNSYVVYNMLEKVDGTTANYNTSSYATASSGTYIAPKGTSLTLASIYTVPTGAAAGTFKGMNAAAPSSSTATLTSTAPTLSANSTYSMWFARSTYALTLNKGTGISGVSGAGTYKYGKKVSIDATVSAGYTWENWTKSAGNDPASATTKNTTVTIKSATTLTANASVNTYTVNYYQGNNSTTAGNTKLGSSSHTYGVAKALTTYATLGGTAPSGWTFAGWSTTQDGTTVAHTDGKSVSNLASAANGTVNLYAVFKKTINVYSGLGKATNNSQTQYYNPYKTTGSITSISLATPAAVSNWTTLGYRTDTSASTSTQAAGSVTPAYNTTPTYYAVYSRTLTINYNGNGSNGGSTSSTTATQYYNTNGSVSTPSFTLAANGFTRTGYTFSKWDLGNAGATYNSWTPGVSESVSKTAEAQWSANKYLVSLNYNDNIHGAAEGVEMEYDSGTTISNPTREGYIFMGWNITGMDGVEHTIGTGTTTSTSENNVYGTGYMNLHSISGSVVIFQAQWIPRTDTKYMVYHYLKEVGKDTYELLDAYTETYYGTSDAEITLADYKKISSELGGCGTYTSGSLESSVNGPSTVITTTTIGADGETKIYLYYTRSKYRVELGKDAYIQAVGGDGLYECGAKITVTANPMDGYHFRRWRIEGEGEIEEKEDDS